MKMRKISFTTIIVTAMTVFSAVVVLSGLPTVQASSDSAAGPAGSWLVNLTPDPNSGLPPEMNIASLSSDGRFINVEANGHASAGEWERTAGRGFAMTIMGLLIDNGQPIRGKARASCELSLRGQEFDCQFAAEYYDLQGNVLFSVTGTAHGERFGVEPL